MARWPGVWWRDPRNVSAQVSILRRLVSRKRDTDRVGRSPRARSRRRPRPDRSLLDRNLDARFVPGRTFAARFRIVSLLGRGAIGEVYRADDLRLGQPGLGRIVLRRTWLAVLLLLVLNVLLSAWSWTPTALFYAIGIAGLFCFVVLQLGLLAGVAMLAISRVLTSLPLTLDFDAWYVASSASVLLLVLAVSVLAFRMTIRRDRVEMPVGVHQAHQQVR